MSWAVVTGAAKGIGAVVAEHAVKAGYLVSAWDVDATAVRQLADRVDGVTPCVVDVTDEAAVAEAAEQLAAPPALVVNNAGMVRFGPLMDLSLADWDAALRLNLTGTFLVARATARRMAGLGGCIVNLASINGVASAPNAGSYTASKAGIIRLTEQMAMEWAQHGIRVNTVAPGLIDAGMSEPIYADPAARRQRTSHVPLGRLGTAEDVADAEMFLASEKASYVTGQNLVVDGGLTKAVLAGLARPRAVDGGQW